MRIATEIGWGHKTGGARRVALRVLQELLAGWPEHEYLLYCNSFQAGLAASKLRQRILPAPAYFPQTLWDQFVFPHLAVPLANRRMKPDLIHYTNNMVSLFGRVPTVVSIYDMTPFVIPASFRSLHTAYQQAYFRLAARKAAKIVTISENSKRDICRYLPAAAEKVVVVPLAADPPLPASLLRATAVTLHARFGIREPFLLYVGAIHPRKNVRRIIQAFARLKKEQQLPHKLVIAGAMRWMAAGIIEELAGADLAEAVVFTGVLTEEELAALYSTCAVFVWPSLYEGFGLPVLEAMSYGAPVVTSNTSSLPEVAGEAALLVDPLSVAEIGAAISRILADGELATRLSRLGRERAAQFSWQRTAAEIWRVYEAVV